jgi:hypothetical protein
VKRAPDPRVRADRNASSLPGARLRLAPIQDPDPPLSSYPPTATDASLTPLMSPPAYDAAPLTPLVTPPTDDADAGGVTSTFDLALLKHFSIEAYFARTVLEIAVRPLARDR